MIFLSRQLAMILQELVLIFLAISISTKIRSTGGVD